MAFFNSAVGVLQTLVIALGAGLGIWGVVNCFLQALSTFLFYNKHFVNLIEGYGNDNPGAKSKGMKHVIPDLLEQ